MATVLAYAAICLVALVTVAMLLAWYVEKHTPQATENEVLDHINLTMARIEADFARRKILQKEE
jgi:hypothetical protein